MFRQVGKAGLGPKLFPSPKPGIIVMEALVGGTFEADFGPQGLNREDAKRVADLVRNLHKLDTRGSVEVAAQNTRALVEAKMEDCGMTTKDDLEQIWKTRGGYGMLLLWWWGVAYPQWLKRHHPTHFPLREEYRSRVMALIIRVLRLKTKTRTMMTSLRFSHADLWSGNLLRKDNNKILAIDFEMATTAPGFVDLGGLLFNWDFHFEENLKYLDPGIRETMVANYLGHGQSLERTEVNEALFDLEIGFLHRFIFVLLCKHLDVKEDVCLEEIMLVHKGEMMANALEREEPFEEVQRRLVEQGVHIFVQRTPKN